MDAEKLKIATKELGQAVVYPLEMRIAKYLVQAGYSGWNDDIPKLIAELDNTIARAARLKVWGYMRDFKNIHSPKNPYHIDNVPDLFPK